jgi:hypothetical protein
MAKAQKLVAPHLDDKLNTMVQGIKDWAARQEEPDLKIGSPANEEEEHGHH